MSQNSNISSTTLAPTPVPVAYLKWDGYVRASIDLFGIFSNIVNILVFLSPKLTDTSYKFMHVKAVSNLVYFIIAFETEILTFCVNCPWSSSYAAGFNYCYVYIYFSGCLQLLSIMIDVVLSVYTYCILINKPWPGRFTFLWISLGLFALALAFYGQKPLVFAVYPLANTGNFYYTISPFGASVTNKTIQIVQNFTKIILSILVVTIINFFNVIKFSKRFKSRVLAVQNTVNSNTGKTLNSVQRQNHSMTGVNEVNHNAKKSNQSHPGHEAASAMNSNKNNKNSQNNISMTKNITRMVIVSLFINVIGKLPSGIVFTINTVGVSSPALTMSTQITNILILLPSSLELIVYYLFNKLFKGVINDFLKKVHDFFIRT